jgi:hypothetical protein
MKTLLAALIKIIYALLHTPVALIRVQTVTLMSVGEKKRTFILVF